jgi:hypothetical protein
MKREDEMKQRNDETTTEGSTTNRPNRPAKEFRLGTIRATVWERAGTHGSLYHITVSRLYRDRDDRWSSSGSFGREDLPLLAKVLDQAHTWAYENARNQTQEQPTGDEAQGGQY